MYTKPLFYSEYVQIIFEKGIIFKVQNLIPEHLNQI